MRQPQWILVHLWRVATDSHFVLVGNHTDILNWSFCWTYRAWNNRSLRTRRKRSILRSLRKRSILSSFEVSVVLLSPLISLMIEPLVPYLLISILSVSFLSWRHVLSTSSVSIVHSISVTIITTIIATIISTIISTIMAPILKLVVILVIAIITPIAAPHRIISVIRLSTSSSLVTPSMLVALMMASSRVKPSLVSTVVHIFTDFCLTKVFGF